MAVPNIDSVKKVSETLSKNPVEAPNKEHFDSLMKSPTSTSTPSFERIDPSAMVPEDSQTIEKNPIFGNENVSSQKSGTATDQDQKRRQQPENDEVEEVGSTRSKKSDSTSKSTSLMDEVSQLNKNVSNISNSSPEMIKKQAKDMIAQLEQVKTKLSQAQTQIKPSYQTLLRNRLTHIDDNLKIALNKAGVEYTAPEPSKGNPSVVQKFIGMVTNSQSQIDHLGNAVANVNNEGELSMANMFAIQLKMGYVQQQIELFSSLLNKALESTKTLMNVQV